MQAFWRLFVFTLRGIFKQYASAPEELQSQWLGSIRRESFRVCIGTTTLRVGGGWRALSPWADLGLIQVPRMREHAGGNNTLLSFHFLMSGMNQSTFWCVWETNLVELTRGFGADYCTPPVNLTTMRIPHSCHKLHEWSLALRTASENVVFPVHNRRLNPVKHVPLLI
jgi:hypothetical protein